MHTPGMEAVQALEGRPAARDGRGDDTALIERGARRGVRKIDCGR
jgi:hypothetical protein